MTIRSFSDIDFRAFNRRLPNDPILNAPRFHLYASGRAAIYAVAQSVLHIHPSSKAYLPFYHCGVEVEAFLRAGYAGVTFYPVDDSLHLDQQWLTEQHFSPGDILFVIHYFGFPQQINRLAEFCKSRGMILVEDCAHALYSCYQNRLLGTCGDLGVYSLHKTIPLPNGGGALINSPGLPAPSPGMPQFLFSTMKSVVFSALSHEVSSNTVWKIPAKAVLGLWRALKTNKSSDMCEPKEDSEEATPWYYDNLAYDYKAAINPLSRRFLHPTPVMEIVQARRRNYLLLSEYFLQRKDAQLVFADLAEGVCPLCLPLWVHSSDIWMAALHKIGIEGFVFGRLPHPSIPVEYRRRAEKYRTCLVGLPVHQGLAESDIQLLLQKLRTLPHMPSP
jgi:perosamine synthetase